MLTINNLMGATTATADSHRRRDTVGHDHDQPEGIREMSHLTALRRGRIASAAIPAIALAVAGLIAAAPGAQAAVRAPATPALHGHRISLGTTSDVFGDSFTEAPNGTVFFSRGSVVYVVEGNRAPAIALHASHPVLALAANWADLFVQTGLQVTEYSRADGAQVRHWTLTSPVTPVTSGGLYAVGSTVWSWTDWASDESGFEYATISRIHTSSSAVHVVDTSAYPADMSADSAGLYFETQHGVNGYLGHANPATSTVQLRKAPVDAPLALAHGRVDELASGSTSEHLYSYNASTLAFVSAKKVPEKDAAIAGTGLGLLVLAQGCNGFPCSAATVGKLSVSTGGTSGALPTPGGYQLLTGPSAAVVEVSDVHGTHADMFLVRISS
jgi:hypothetical protein